MRQFLLFISLSAATVSFSQGINTQTRDDAGASGPGILSGFYQTAYPVNFPSVAPANQWWHLLDVRHTSTTNNYAMQFSGSFFDQNLYFRKTNNNGAQQWSKVILEQPGGKIGIGKQAVLQERFTITEGHETTTFLMHAENETNPHAYLSLWASEPVHSWTGVGIGNNVRNYHNGAAFVRINPSQAASYMRLLENAITFNFITAAGNNINPFTINSAGDSAFKGKIEAKEIKVTTSPTADFVFEESYELPRLNEVEKFIKENKHLPEIASAEVMEKEGVNIGEFQIKLLQKIEELTLYGIEQNKKLQKLEHEINDLKNK